MSAEPKLRITVLAAGAAGMYCGSCIRDNALALALRRLGHDAVMVPLYTPVKTDGPSAASGQVFFGGLNAWLQHASGFFRHTPRALDWLLDRPWLLNWAGSYGAQTSPAKLGEFTLDVLRGESGNTVKELRRLVRFLKEHLRPQVVTLPNLMFIGAARMLKVELGCAVVAECTGEDIFLDAMAEPHKSAARDIIRQRAGDVDRFVATSAYYADHVAEYLGADRSRVEVSYPGIAPEDVAQDHHRRSSALPTVGYLARICPEKGIDTLVEAMIQLRRMPGMQRAQLRAAGYLGKAHQKWYRELERKIAASELSGSYQYLGEVTKADKLKFMDSIDVLCVPTAYAEAKGLYVLESLARGTPVVLPAHGSFPELVAQTGGGVTTPPGDTNALAYALAGLLADPAQRQTMGDRGRQAVFARFLDEHMAQGMVRVFQRLLSGESSREISTAAARQPMQETSR